MLASMDAKIGVRLDSVDKPLGDETQRTFDYVQNAPLVGLKFLENSHATNIVTDFFDCVFTFHRNNLPSLAAVSSSMSSRNSRMQ